jgi:pimeloyl-ACP methyl ester carboxylesterase
MNESMITVGDLELCYETFGDRTDAPLLLVMGLGTQMIGWPDEFCETLAERGFHVIRYDNRDVGRSTHLSHLAPPSVKQLLLRDKTAAHYTLADMAGDGVGLLDALGIPAAHVVGASMGGMIAQTMAARFPEHVLSLASIMSTTGHRWKGQPGLRVYPLFLRRPRTHRDAAIEAAMVGFKRIGSPGFELDEAHLRRVAGTAYDRGYDPAGSGRQLAAIIAGGDRTAEVRRITAPTVVIHGTSDVMVRPSGGRATHRAIAGSRMVWIEGMGHDLPRAVWPELIAEIERNAARAHAGARTTTA